MASLPELLSLNDLVSLVEASHDLAEKIDYQGLLATILETATKLTESPDGSIILPDPRRKTLYFAHAVGAKAEFLLETFGENATQQIPWESKAGEVFRKGRSEVMSSSAKDPKHFKGVDEATEKRTESMVTIPLMAAHECVGVLQVLNKEGEYTDRDRIILEQFADQAGIALRNATLISDLLAHMGLYSRHQKTRNANELIKLLSAPPQSEKMTVMFVDLRGFRALCQRITTPQKLTRMLDQFLSMLVDRILSYKGIVNKYLGDGVLALFRGEDHELNAVNCAFDMIDAFTPVKTSWISETSADISFVDIGIGVCTDDVIIGPVGSDEVKDFSVIGTVVNLAAAFEFEARNGRQVLVDEPTLQKVKGFYDYDNPVSYELRHPGQPTGHKYNQYNLRGRKRAPARPLVCFISFSYEDRAFVEERVVHRLKQEGIESWMAPLKLRPGRQWLNGVTEGLENADFVLVIVSKNSAKSKWVPREINVAMTIPRLSDRIIPLCIDESLPETVHRILAPIERIDQKDLPRIAERISHLVPKPRRRETKR
jgi:adenylate cyclase